MKPAKRPVPPIEGEGLRLRLLREEDLPMTLSWRNREEIRRWFHDSRVLPWETHRAWFAGYVERDNDFVFIIETTADGPRPVGQVSLYDIDWDGRRAEFGRLMIGDPAASGKGYARAATALLLSFAFRELGLEEIYLSVITGNEPALAIYRRCGFVVRTGDGLSLTMAVTKSGFEKGGAGCAGREGR